MSKEAIYKYASEANKKILDKMKTLDPYINGKEISILHFCLEMNRKSYDREEVIRMLDEYLY